MLMPWELLLLANIPRDGLGGDGPSGGPGGGPGGDGPGSDGTGGEGGEGEGGDDGGDEGGDEGGEDSDADAAVGPIGGGPNATPGYGAGSMAAGAANIAGTSGGPEAAAQNAAGTSVEGMVGAMLGSDADRSASSISSPDNSVSPSVSPTSSSSIASVAAGMTPGVSVGVTDALGNTSIGGFGLGGVMGGVAGANVSGGLGSLGGLGTTSGTTSGTQGVSGVTGVGGLSGVAELGDTGPQGFAATESGFAPSTSAPDVSNGLAAIGLSASEPAFLGDMGSISSLAQAAATPAEGLTDMGLADPTGMSTGFTGMGLGTVGIGPTVDAAVQSISSFGAQNIGAYGMPGYSSPSPSVSPPTGMQAATVGFAGTPGITSMSSQDLSNQLGSMSQPSAQQSIGSPSPSVSSYGFSGANIGSVQGLTGTSTAAPTSTSTSSLAQAASNPPAESQGVSRSASSISAEEGPQEQTGIMGLLGSPAVSALANMGLSLGIPGYGLANLGVMGLTGTSIYGQGVSLASGQGLQTGGGLMGLAGGANLGQGAGPASTASGGEAGGGGNFPEPTTGIPAPQYTPVESQISDAPVQAIPYNVANFGPTPMPGYRVVPTPSPAFYGNTLTKPQVPPAAYFVAQGYPTNPPIPTFYSDYVTREGYRGQVPPYNV